MPDCWFLFDKKDDVLEIHICGEITDEHSWVFFSELRDNLPVAQINLLVNSTGGDVFTAVGLYNRLECIAREGTPIRAVIEGICSSAASIIAMAAQEIAIPEGGFMHVHYPRGDEKYVGTFSDAFQRILMKKTGRSRDEVATLLANGTWLNGRECLWEKLADTIVA